jgi:nitrogen fixation NifU-like protein
MMSVGSSRGTMLPGRCGGELSRQFIVDPRLRFGNEEDVSRYSETLMEHFLHPRNVGRMEDADQVGQGGTEERPPFIVMYFRLRDGVVVEVRFQTFGCGALIASGSMLTDMVANRPVEECLKLTEEDLAQALGGIPPDKGHCPRLAIEAMRNGLSQLGCRP